MLLPVYYSNRVSDPGVPKCVFASVICKCIPGRLYLSLCQREEVEKGKSSMLMKRFDRILGDRIFFGFSPEEKDREKINL